MRATISRLITARDFNDVLLTDKVIVTAGAGS